MDYDLARFTNVLPLYAQKFAPEMVKNADERVTPFLIFGIGDRETRWGTISEFRKDTGDWAPRLWSHDRIGKFPHVNVVGHKQDRFLVMPFDGLGWGRGLMQLDFVAEFAWLQQNDWRDPRVNIARGVEHLRTKFDFFASPAGADPIVVTNVFALKYSTIDATVIPGSYRDTRPFVGGALEAAATAAYNAEKENVLMSTIGGGLKAVDVCTTGQDYSRDVHRRALTMQLRYGA